MSDERPLSPEEIAKAALVDYSRDRWYATVRDRERQIERARVEGLEDAACIADKHVPEYGHAHQEDAVSCQMSIAVEIRRLKGIKGRSLIEQEHDKLKADVPLWEAMRDGASQHIARLHVERDDLKQQRDEAEANCVGERAQFKAERDGLLDQVEQLKNRLVEHEERSKQLQSERDELVARLWSCDAERLRHQAERDELKRQLADKNACSHDHLNMDGICYACGADRRGF